MGSSSYPAYILMLNGVGWTGLTGDRLAPVQYYTASIQPSIGSIVYLFMHSQDIPGSIAGG